VPISQDSRGGGASTIRFNRRVLFEIAVPVGNSVTMIWQDHSQECEDCVLLNVWPGRRITVETRVGARNPGRRVQTETAVIQMIPGYNCTPGSVVRTSTIPPLLGPLRVPPVGETCRHRRDEVVIVTFSLGSSCPSESRSLVGVVNRELCPSHWRSLRWGSTQCPTVC